MTDRAEDFHAALWTDLRRNRTDADLTDVKYLAAEADHALSHLRQWMKPLSVSTPPVLGPPVSRYGSTRSAWASSSGRRA